MQPQGTALVNTQFFADLTAQVNAIEICADLQAVVTAAMASIQAQVTAIQQQIVALLPLTTIPHDLPSVITWISNLAGPYVIAHDNYIAQLAQVLAAIGSLVTAIENAASRMTSCSITIPAVA